MSYDQLYKRWYTTTEYVDIETGEIINKSLVIITRDYIVKYKQIEYKEHESYKEKKIRYCCEKNRQTKLKL